MFSPNIHRYLFLFGLFSLAFGLMVGSVPTSVPQFILLGNWIIEGDYKRKFNLLKTNKLFWIITSIFFLHLIGMLYTENINDGLTDLRIKLPLLFLPGLLFSSNPIDVKEFKILLYCFIAGSAVNTGWCLIYNYILHTNDVARNASRFMSHIRLGLYLNVAIASCFYFMLQHAKTVYKMLFGILLLYFIFSLYALGLASGFVNLSILSAFALISFLFKQKLYVKLGSIVILLGVICYMIYYFTSFLNSQLVVQKTETNSPRMYNAAGNICLNSEISTQKENGNYVYMNIQTIELQKEWSRRFPEDSFTYTPPYNLQRYNVLIRYMASKGLYKDSAGISLLSNEDFKNIQNNITNYKYPEWGFMQKRIYEFVWEYDEFMNDRSVNGHSLTMRLYFWKAASVIIKNNLLFGVGTGDVQNQLNKTYVETHSPLSKDWFKRPHNQFITITVSLGMFGLLIFLFSFIYPVIKLKKQIHILFWPYFLILCISFILEDTLETQAGLSFYAFFYSIFIAQAYYLKKQQNPAGL
ncbi:MAG: O-antigen ligase family protein [Bacteroidia bacterium]|nr:O-antigen ligase family protein [Bacteroidia bacterium]